MRELTPTRECVVCSILRVLAQGGWHLVRTYTVLGLTYRTYRRGSERCSLLILGRSFSMWTSLKPRQELWHIWQDVNLLWSYSKLEEIFIRRIHNASSASTMKSIESRSRELSTGRTTEKDQIALSKLLRPME